MIGINEIEDLVEEALENRETFKKSERRDKMIGFFILLGFFKKLFCISKKNKLAIRQKLDQAEQAERKFIKAGDMINVMKSIHRLNLFMNSQLTRSQRILTKFQRASVIDTTD